MDNKKIFRCRHCGNVVSMVYASGVPIVCCGEDMYEMIPNTVDAAVEKHVPVVTIEGNILKVTIGEVMHPMTDEHYIEWIYVVTSKGTQLKYLKPGDVPVHNFAITEDTVLEVYEYCNLHGLWKKDMK